MGAATIVETRMIQLPTLLLILILAQLRTVR